MGLCGDDSPLGNGTHGHRECGLLRTGDLGRAGHLPSLPGLEEEAALSVHREQDAGWGCREAQVLAEREPGSGAPALSCFSFLE